MLIVCLQVVRVAIGKLLRLLKLSADAQELFLRFGF